MSDGGARSAKSISLPRCSACASGASSIAAPTRAIVERVSMRTKAVS